jgi:hypothetical protein
MFVVCRIEDQGLLSSFASEHFGSECSLSESVRAATAHMATLRSLLVNHITETHDARTSNGKLTGPNLLDALQERQQQHAGAQWHAAAQRTAVRIIAAVEAAAANDLLVVHYMACASKQTVLQKSYSACHSHHVQLYDV